MATNDLEQVLSDIELQMISIQLAKLTDEEIAFAIDKPLHLVRQAICDFTSASSGRISKSNSIKQKCRRAQHTEDFRRIKSIAVQRTLLKKKKLEQNKYQTRQVDYSAKILVRVDNKTLIYINAGDDPKAAIAVYKLNHKKHLGNAR